MATPPFPLPTPTAVSEQFWDGAAQDRLLYQRCAACEHAIFPPRRHCTRCWSSDLSWQESAGSGTLASYASVHRPGHPAFAELTPYTLVLVDLDEGYRMLSRLSGAEGAAPDVGARVQVSWQSQGTTRLPLFTTKETT